MRMERLETVHFPTWLFSVFILSKSSRQGGGMVLTNDKMLYEKLNLYRSHGITRDAAKMSHESDGPWYYQQITLGYNYRMTDI